MKKYTMLGLLAVCALLALAGMASARNTTITIPMKGVAVYSADRGDYYLVKFVIPADVVGKRLDSALLEFVVDATPTTEAEENLAPMVQVFPLTEAFTGASPTYRSDVPSVHPVAMGENRRVLVDITDVVRSWIAAPSSNLGLVIGSLTGPKVGAVWLKSAELAADTALRVTFFYQNRSGERVSR